MTELFQLPRVTEWEMSSHSVSKQYPAGCLTPSCRGSACGRKSGSSCGHTSIIVHFSSKPFQCCFSWALQCGFRTMHTHNAPAKTKRWQAWELSSCECYIQLQNPPADLRSGYKQGVEVTEMYLKLSITVSKCYSFWTAGLTKDIEM
jgi:hypothetical protein